MPWITKDSRVVPILKRLHRGAITEQYARNEMQNLTPVAGSEFGYLKWEIDEAINVVRGGQS